MTDAKEQLVAAMSGASRDLMRISMYAGEVARHVTWLTVYADTGKVPKGRTRNDAALTAWNVNHVIVLASGNTKHAFHELLAKVHARWRYDSGLPLSLKHFRLLIGKSDSLARWLISEGKVKSYEDPDHGLRTSAGRPPGVWVLPEDAKPFVDEAAA